MDKELKEDLRRFLEDWFYGSRERLRDDELERYFDFYSDMDTVFVEIYTDRLLKDGCSENYLSPYTPDFVDPVEIGDYFGINTDNLSQEDLEYLARKYNCERELEKSIEDILFEHGYEPDPNTMFYPKWSKRK